MLKETEAEKNNSFFVTFLSWVAFQLGGPLGPPGYAYNLSSQTVASKKKRVVS